MLGDSGFLPYLCSMIRTAFICSLLFMLGVFRAQAQRRIVVLDMDTDLPVRDVSVRANGSAATKTDVLGRANVPLTADSISFSHVLYCSERLAMAELGDTMYLLPVEHLLPEVRVTELNPSIKGMISAWALAGAMMGAAEAPRGIASFDFASMLDRRSRRDKKHLERAKEILKEWDKKKTD
jgi:hypothetical protein